MHKQSYPRKVSTLLKTHSIPRQSGCRELAFTFNSASQDTLLTCNSWRDETTWSRIPCHQVSWRRLAQSFNPLHEIDSVSEDQPIFLLLAAHRHSPGVFGISPAVFQCPYQALWGSKGRCSEDSGGFLTSEQQLQHCVLELNKSVVPSQFHIPALREAAALLAVQVAILFWNFF